MHNFLLVFLQHLNKIPSSPIRRWRQRLTFFTRFGVRQTNSHGILHIGLICSTPVYSACSLRKHPFLLALRRWGRFAKRFVPSGEERGETDVFAGYSACHHSAMMCSYPGLLGNRELPLISFSRSRGKWRRRKRMNLWHTFSREDTQLSITTIKTSQLNFKHGRSDNYVCVKQPSLSKWDQVHNISCENEFYLHENEKSFPHQRLSTTSFWYRDQG